MGIFDCDSRFADRVWRTGNNQRKPIRLPDLHCRLTRVPACGALPRPNVYSFELRNAAYHRKMFL